MTKDEALKLALEALDGLSEQYDVLKAQEAIREALAQPEQEPVAWRFQSPVGGWAYGAEPPIGSKYAVEPLYTTPPQRPSRSDIKPLTDEEIEDIWADCPADWDDKINVLTLARAIEAAHGIKGEA